MLLESLDPVTYEVVKTLAVEIHTASVEKMHTIGEIKKTILDEHRVAILNDLAHKWSTTLNVYGEKISSLSKELERICAKHGLDYNMTLCKILDGIK